MSRRRYSEHLKTLLIEAPVNGEMRECKVEIVLDPEAARALAFRATQNLALEAIDGALKAVVMEPRK